MKIQCDVCQKDEASLFCVADEAALCTSCDHRVHHANKVAGKHQRFSLQHPSLNQAPLCDICQERRAFLFCQQDRAILCRQCDVPIHNANEHTQKHARFLLTGVQLSAKATLYSRSESSALTNDNNNTKKSKITPYTAKGAAVQTAPGQSCNNNNNNDDDVQIMSFDGSMIPASSISEYMEMLPGWHVEDFLDSSSSSSFPYGLSKNGENELPAFWEHADYFQSFPTEKMGISNSSEDNSFAVPRIVSKRSTNFY